MSVSFINEPNTKSLNAAYRPVILRVVATATDGSPLPPVVYCDIYFNGVYYKTMAKSQYAKINIGSNSEWQFDIQDASQEYLRFYLGVNGGSAILNASPAVLSAYVKVRSSGINSNGFITPEGTAPVQGYGDSAPIAGTGTQSVPFYIFNVALQHDDNQDLYQNLLSYEFGQWVNQYAPLTHRPKTYLISPGDSDYFPLINEFNYDTINTLSIFVQLKGQTSTSFLGLSIAIVPPVNSVLLYIPAGPKNLMPLFPSLDFNKVSNYYLQLIKSDAVLATTVMYKVVKACEDTLRIHFVNSLGTIDAINFELINLDTDTKSNKFERPDTYPLDITKHGINRIDISSNDTYTVQTICYAEEQLPWLKELLNTPAAWLEWPGKQQMQDSYLPIVVSDGKLNLVKQDNRYQYQTTLQFTLSHEDVTLRN